MSVSPSFGLGDRAVDERRLVERLREVGDGAREVVHIGEAVADEEHAAPAGRERSGRVAAAGETRDEQEREQQVRDHRRVRG